MLILKIQMSPIRFNPNHLQDYVLEVISLHSFFKGVCISLEHHHHFAWDRTHGIRVSILCVHFHNL